MTIKLQVPFEGSNGQQMLSVLFDQETTFSCIHPGIALKIGVPQKMRRSLNIVNRKKNLLYVANEKIVSDFNIHGIRLSDEFAVIPNLGEDAIIGDTTLQKWRIKLDFEHDTVIIDPKIAGAILKNLK